MKKIISAEQEADSDIDNALDVLSNIIIDMYLAMTSEQRKSFIKMPESGKK